MAAVTDAQIPPLRALCPGPSGDGGQVGSIGQTSPRIHRFGHELNRPRCTPPSLLAIPPQRLREAEHRPPPRIRGSCSIRFRNRLSPSTKSSRAAGTPPCANRAATPIKLSRISPVCENFGALCTTLARSPCTSTKSKRIRRVIADSAWPAPRPASLPRGTGRPKNRSSDGRQSLVLRILTKLSHRGVSVPPLGPPPRACPQQINLDAGVDYCRDQAPQPRGTQSATPDISLADASTPSGTPPASPFESALDFAAIHRTLSHFLQPNHLP